jgi:uncharacterized membrane protein YecN with MAPEG domain
MPLVLKMTALYIVLNAAIMVALAANVIRVRYRTRTRFGDSSNPEMMRAIRAHGNNTEYVPIALILLLLAHHLGGGLPLIHAIGLPLTVGRILHGFGFLLRGHETPTGHSYLRLSGMILTFFAILAGILGCLRLVAAAPA